MEEKEMEDEVFYPWKYGSIVKLNRLFPGPEIALGCDINWKLKLDGSCTCNSNKDDELRFSSRNHRRAAKDMVASFNRTREAPRLEALVLENPTLFAFGELLQKGASPTKIEFHKIDRWVGFNIRDMSLGKKHAPAYFLPNDEAYEIYRTYKIPTALIWDTSFHNDLDSLFEFNEKMLKLAKKRRREGVVGETHDSTVRWKTKVDREIPRKPKNKQVKERRPILPESEAYGAIDKVFAGIGMEEFRDKSISMPLISRAIQEEMKKHECGHPRRNFYTYYLSYLADKEKAIESYK